MGAQSLTPGLPGDIPTVAVCLVFWPRAERRVGSQFSDWLRPRSFWRLSQPPGPAAVPSIPWLVDAAPQSWPRSPQDFFPMCLPPEFPFLVWTPVCGLILAAYAKTLFPSKVVFTGRPGLGPDIGFWGTQLSRWAALAPSLVGTLGRSRYWPAPRSRPEQARAQSAAGGSGAGLASVNMGPGAQNRCPASAKTELFGSLWSMSGRIKWFNWIHFAWWHFKYRNGTPFSGGQKALFLGL